MSDGFEKSRKHNFAAHVFDRTMGQSAEFYINQGNEVNMNSAFIFNYLDKPSYARITQERYSTGSMATLPIKAGKEMKMKVRWAAGLSCRLWACSKWMGA